MSKYRNWWHPNVVRVIRAYPQLRARKDALHGQNMTANYSASPRAGGASRTAENVALRSLAPAEEDALSAVEQAIALVALQPDGDKVLRLIRRYYWGYGEGFLLIADVVAGLEGMDALRMGLLIMRLGIWLEDPTPEHREGLAAAARLLAKQMAKNEP